DHLRYQKDSGNRNRSKMKYMKQLWISGSYESMYIKSHVRKLIIGCSLRFYFYYRMQISL
ncbi:hypothetical protein ACNF42_08600, partial [Cuniculiplasma sp. SKW3]|uniref:hypothetical protein n=1 Tax=Cuniculiplasma sp. SKW3 TaxID=3400170 RepID=UPI003FD0271A